MTGSDEPFLVGVEYYRAPMPPPALWERDFARIRAAGMRIIRSFSPWNLLQPAPGRFAFDDLDRFFDLAARNDLLVWLDTPVGTHMACPEWLLEQYPDMRVERHDGRVQQPTATPASPFGAMIHNIDHPQWRPAVESLITGLVERYRRHDAMHIWGTWDGINFSGAWGGDGYPPYNAYTIDRYRSWLRERFTLAELGERLLRTYASWDAVEAPRSHNSPVAMSLYREFHYANLAEHLGWLSGLIDALDGAHEQRSHGSYQPRPWDEICSAQIDGWGVSHPSAGGLTGTAPDRLAEVTLGYQWSRAIGRNQRWWCEEIYAGVTGGLRPRDRQPRPRELTVALWLSLIEGAAGALFWQYRPEYASYEAPGLSLAALDGGATPRLIAVEETIGELDTLRGHLPLSMPRQDVAVAYSAASHDAYLFGGDEDGYRSDVLGLHHWLWSHSYASEMVSTAADWSGYRAVVLPSCARLDAVATANVRRTLDTAAGPALLIVGHFALFAGGGHWSMAPPEGLAELIPVRVADVDLLSAADIAAGHNRLDTGSGEVAVPSPAQYAVLEPGPGWRPFATLNGSVVGVEREDGRVRWCSLPLGRAFQRRPPDGLLSDLLGAAGVVPRIATRGDPVVAYERRSCRDDTLLFVLNPGPGEARATLRWPTVAAAGAPREPRLLDALSGEPVAATGGSVPVRLASGAVQVLLVRSDDSGGPSGGAVSRAGQAAASARAGD